MRLLCICDRVNKLPDNRKDTYSLYYGIFIFNMIYDILKTFYIDIADKSLTRNVFHSETQELPKGINSQSYRNYPRIKNEK